MVSKEFTDYVNGLGLKINYDDRCPICPITLYVDMGENRQAYKHFGNEQEAIEHIKNGWFFGHQGLWDQYINKFPDRCDLAKQ